MITLCIRYTLDTSKLAEFEAYARSVAAPIERCGGKVVGYYAPGRAGGRQSRRGPILHAARVVGVAAYRGPRREHSLGWFPRCQYQDFPSTVRVSCSCGIVHAAGEAINDPKSNVFSRVRPSGRRSATRPPSLAGPTGARA